MPDVATDVAARAALEQRGVAVIKGLAMDAPLAAHSGHQGTAMALAPLAHVLYTRILRHDPSEPEWPDRDRFVLSAGHASILQYALLHLTGYPLSLDDLRAFRQWDSLTPGHPEAGHTVGIEVTTGPLGQGFANGVGMALAERSLRSRFGSELFDHRIYAICSDGDLMEGVSHEAASFAGHQRLGRLVYVYDDNHVTIDGRTELTLSDDVFSRFSSYGWHVIEVGEAAEDLDRLEAALRAGTEEEDQPSLIVLRSHIAFPSPDLTDDPKAHGNPFDDDQVRRTKEVLGLPPDETFYVPDDVAAFYREAGEAGRATREAWEARRAVYTGDREEVDACLRGRGVEGWAAKLPSWSPGERVATRKAAATTIGRLMEVVPGLVAGGADLTGNTGTQLPDSAGVMSAAEPTGRQLHFGVREHAMGAALVGMAHHGGVVPVGGTFLVFSDYMRPAVRLAALSRARCVFVWSHDSVGVGEDGPTHQPVEHVMALRAIPGLTVIRPADANETALAWKVAVDGDGPVAMILTRQDVPVLEGTADAPVELGGYVLVDAPDAELVLVGTGSEVHLCIEAAERLRGEGVAARVVSLPSWELFDAQPAEYQADVLPPGLPTLSVEAGRSLGWSRWADDSVAVDRFGASAPGSVVLDHLGINTDHVVDRARALLGAGREEHP